MFSRLSVQKAKPIIKSLSLYPRALSVAKSNALNRYPHDAPERDLVNFPPPRMPTYPGKVRLGFLPNEWFDFMYDKTGVTGPYILFWGGIATILSKEIFVYWADTLEHMVFLGLLIAFHIKAGPKIAKFLDKNVEDEEKELRNNFAAGLKVIDEQLANIESEKGLPEMNKLLFEAKRENVGLQLEAAYRQRLQTVYTETKRRLDYHVAMQSVFQRLEKQQMLNFVLNEVRKAITPAHERDFLQSCLGQLKTLAVKHGNTI